MSPVINSPIFLRLLLLASTCVWSLPAQSQSSHELDSLVRIYPQARDSNQLRLALHIATYYLAFRELDSADKYLQAGTKAAEEQQLPRYEAIAHDMNGQLLGLKGKFAQSISWHERAMKEWEALNRPSELSISLNNIGNIYLKINAYDEALACYHRSLLLAKENQDSSEMIGTLSNIGLIYRSLEQPTAAKSYFLEALAIDLTNRNPFTKVSVYMSLASCYMDLGQADSAEFYGKKGLEITQAAKHSSYERAALITLAHHQLQAKNWDEALKYLSLYGLPEEDTDSSRQTYWLNYQAEAYWGKGDRTRGLSLARQELATAQQLKNDILLNNAHEQLFRFYKELGQFEAALAHHEAFRSMQDSIFQGDQKQEIQRLEVIFETEKMKAEVEQWRQKAEIESLKVRQRNLGILLLLICFAAIGAWVFFRNRHRLLREQYHRLQTEQRLLRSQTNPHFFFHALSGIQQFILQAKDLNQSIRYLSRFARLMRSILEQSRTEQICLSEELETLEHYLQLQQLRYDGKFSYHMEVDPILDPEMCLIPPLLLQPIVENAIEHGLAPKVGGGHLSILVREQSSGLLLVVEDDGVGRPQPTTNPAPGRHSLATTIILERLELIGLQSDHAQQASLEITDLKDETDKAIGTRVELRLPHM
jgi:tetratricopeptide (TPR) repeat protein/two-component sensor histidine kinase